MNSKKVIAIIPARSGSKSIKDKNIKKIENKHLIGLSIETCLKSKHISKIFVSTDSKKYAAIAKKYGPVEIIFRPKKISKDFSTDFEMIKHAIENINDEYEFIAHIRPTTPLRKIEDVDLAIKTFIKSKYHSLRSVHEMPETSYKTFEAHMGRLKTLKNLKYSIDSLNSPRQKFKKTFKANGLIDIYRRRFIIKNNLLFGKNVKAFLTPYYHEIDNQEDFDYLKYLYDK